MAVHFPCTLINSSILSLEILQNGKVKTVDFTSGDVDYSEVSVIKTIDSNNIPTWKMIFSGGLTAGVQLKSEIFQLVIEASSNYKGNFQGES